MNTKYLITSLIMLTAGALTAAEIITFYPLGKLGIFHPGEALEFQIKLKDKAPAVPGTVTVKNSSGKVIGSVKLNMQTGKLNKITLKSP